MLSPVLLKVLCEIGHSDTIVITDAIGVLDDTVQIRYIQKNISEQANCTLRCT